MRPSAWPSLRWGVRFSSFREDGKKLLSPTMVKLADTTLAKMKLIYRIREATEDDIAEALGMHVINVLDALITLEKEGLVKSTDA